MTLLLCYQLRSIHKVVLSSVVITYPVLPATQHTEGSHPIGCKNVLLCYQLRSMQKAVLSLVVITTALLAGSDAKSKSHFIMHID